MVSLLKKSKKETMKGGTFRNYWRIVIYVVCSLIMILPFSTSFDPDPEELGQEWSNSFVINTFEYAIFFLPLIFFLLLIPKIGNPIIRWLLIIISILFSSLASLVAVLSVMVPVQDVAPHVGMVLALYLFPIVFVNSILEWKGEESRKLWI